MSARDIVDTGFKAHIASIMFAAVRRELDMIVRKHIPDPMFEN